MDPTAQQRIAEAAVAVEKSHGLPAEVAFAQCALESNWLKSAPGWNCFGIKHYPGAFGRQLLQTWERFTPGHMQAFLASNDGREIISSNPPLYQVRDWFATFPDLESCFVKRAQRWSNGQSLPWVQVFLGKPTRGDGDWKELFRNIAASGYATAEPDKYAAGCLACLNADGSREAIQAARTKSKVGIA